jgi:hypothetical protein
LMALSLPAVEVAGTAAATAACNGCSPAEQAEAKTVTNDVIDVTLAACLLANPTATPATLQTICKYADKDMPIVQQFLAQQAVVKARKLGAAAAAAGP